MNNNYNHIGNQAPYYDDWDPFKNYKRILFNPGVAVQARELTQLQTILQDQLSSSASYMFKNGAPVTGAKISFTSNQPHMTVLETDDEGQMIDVQLLVGREFVGRTSKQKIYVISADSEKRIIYFSYIGSELSDGERFVSVLTPTRTFGSKKGSIGKSITANCQNGILYVNGYFAYIEAQTIIVTNNDNSSLYNIGYKVNSEYVTSGDDPTLNDNAAGFTNYNAPGADRYKVSLELYAFEGETPPEGIEFITGIVIKNGELIKDQENANSNTAFMDMLAKRTYNESGSYTVDPWKAIVKRNEDDIDSFIVSMQEGLGYINGYEIRTVTSSNIIVPKARTSVFREDINVYNTAGLYVLGQYANNIINGKYFLDIVNKEEVEIMSSTNGTGNVLGTCKVSNIRRQNNKLMIYLIEVSSVINMLSSSKSIRSKSDPTRYINLYVNNNKVDIYGQESPDIIKSGFNMVKSVKADNIEYEVTKKYIVQSNSSGNTLVISDKDTHIDFLYIDSIICIYDSEGNHININNISMRPDNSSGISYCTIYSPDIVDSAEYTVIARVRAEFMSFAIKTANEYTETFNVDSNTKSVTLAKEDIFDIVSIVQQNNFYDYDKSSEELKSYFTLDNGQTDHYYDKGKIHGFNSEAINNKKENETENTQYQVTYRYFEHSGSGPFCVDSYMNNNNKKFFSDIEDLYITIPEYKSTNGIYSLRDCLDFRIKKSQLNSYGNSYPVPETELRLNADVYLPRIDNIYVDKNGNFGINEGIPSWNPKAPIGTSDSLVLYTMEIPAYVLSTKTIKLNYIDNQRYTMADISDLETRITNVENTIALTQLESNAMATQITDQYGSSKYKTGIFTDDFLNFDKSDYTDKDWNANIDSINQSLISNFEVKNIDFKLDDLESENIRKDDLTISLPYDLEVYAKNEFASDTINVQAFMFYVWKGSLKLTPSVDTWVTDLGQTVVSEETVGDTVAPPTQFRTWTTSSTRYTGRAGLNQYRHTTTSTQQSTTTYQQQISLEQELVERSSVDEYMQVREVAFELSGMRPGMQIEGYMDNVKLALSSDIIDSNGRLNGTFMVPENMPTGVKLVEMFDKAKTSSASAAYTATGSTVWTDVYNTYVRSYVPVTTTRTISSKTSSVYLDPVAQSFYVEENSGILLDSIDVYFKSKDELVDVYIYIVEMENGYPTNRMIPFSEKHLSPSEVFTSDNADMPTKFKFDDPIFLPGNAEYAFVIATTSYKYSLFVSTLGGTNIYDGTGIFDQPFLGSMFLSQNASTWTAEQQSDITFKMYRRKYDTNTIGTAVFKLEQPEEDFDVVYNLISINENNTSNTNIKYEYKWFNDTYWTPFTNKEDVFYDSMKTIKKTSTERDTSLSVRAILSTNTVYMSPQIDLEQIYGIFTHYTIRELTDEDKQLIIDDSISEEYPFITGTYVSQPINLKYSSTDLRVILDTYTPRNSLVDVYFKTSNYKPMFVNQSLIGSVGTDITTNEMLKGQVLTLYYYNSDTKQLEPKATCQMAGYVDRKIYLTSISDSSRFKNLATTSVVDNVYDGINIKYTHLILMPFGSYVNIDIDNWSSTINYYTGMCVFHNGYIWNAIKDVGLGQIPSDYSSGWKKIPCIKTISEVVSGDTIEWQHMTKDVSALVKGYDEEEKFTEFTYYPTFSVSSEFTSFTIKIVLRSKNNVDAAQVKNLRAIAVV